MEDLKIYKKIENFVKTGKGRDELVNRRNETVIFKVSALEKACLYTLTSDNGFSNYSDFLRNLIMNLAKLEALVEKVN
jgi:hypothetical protein